MFVQAGDQLEGHYSIAFLRSDAHFRAWQELCQEILACLTECDLA